MNINQANKGIYILCMLLFISALPAVGAARGIEGVEVSASETSRSGQLVSELSGMGIASSGKEGGAVPNRQLPEAGDNAKTRSKDLTAFFLIGFIINITVMAFFFFWARGQLRKGRDSKETM